MARVALDRHGSGEDLADSQAFQAGKSGKTYFSPVYLRRGAEPTMTIAVPSGEYAVEVTLAEVNLRAIWDLISQIHIGIAGVAYVVDATGRMVAHPDAMLMQAMGDLSALPQVRAALAGASGRDAVQAGASIGDGVTGGQVLATYAVVSRAGLARVHRAALVGGLRSAAGDDPAQRGHSGNGPAGIGARQHRAGTTHGVADPNTAGRRSPHRLRRVQASHPSRHRRRDPGAGRGIQPRRGEGRGFVHPAGGKGRSAHAGIGAVERRTARAGRGQPGSELLARPAECPVDDHHPRRAPGRRAGRNDLHAGRGLRWLRAQRQPRAE